MNTLTEIELEKIHAHPQNPRKDLGDLTELAESIRKNGIMQNLTVISGHFEDGEFVTGDYTLLIGHRRCEAARLAGIEKVPCKVVEDMSNKEQVSIMLEENMQRSDLTIWEQANGFQMMLDLGDSIQGITEKTGFSETTIKHRLEIAKLSKKAVEAPAKEGFQLSISDYITLEKLKNVKDRNKILQKVTSSKDLKWKVEKAVEDATKEKNKKILEGLLKAANIKKSKHSTWESCVEKKLEINLLKDPPKDLMKYKDMEYCESWSWYTIIKVKDSKKKELSKEELERKAREQRIKKGKAFLREIFKDMDSFVKLVVKGGVKTDEVKLADAWKWLSSRGSYVNKTCAIHYFYDGEDNIYCLKDEQKEAYEKQWDGLTPMQQMFCNIVRALNDGASDNSIMDWYGKYNKAAADRIKKACNILEYYGFGLTEEQDLFLDGKGELFE